MLRGVSARRLQELVDFEQMESPDLRMDLRFAILASVIAAAGNVHALDGKQYSQVHFMEHLQKCLERHDAWVRGEVIAEPETQQQSLETMMFHINSWTRGANNARLEAKGGREALVLIEPGGSRLLLQRLREENANGRSA